MNGKVHPQINYTWNEDLGWRTHLARLLKITLLVRYFPIVLCKPLFVLFEFIYENLTRV